MQKKRIIKAIKTGVGYGLMGLMVPVAYWLGFNGKGRPYGNMRSLEEVMAIMPISVLLSLITMITVSTIVYIFGNKLVWYCIACDEYFKPGINKCPKCGKKLKAIKITTIKNEKIKKEIMTW